MRGPLPSVMLALRRTALAAGLAFAALASAQAEAPKTLKIGQLTDMASALSDATGKGSLIASQLAIDDFGGTVLGRKIELRSADHQLKPSVGASIATEWMDRDGVSAIIGVPASSVAPAVQARMQARPDKVLSVT